MNLMFPEGIILATFALREKPLTVLVNYVKSAKET